MNKDEPAFVEAPEKRMGLPVENDAAEAEIVAPEPPVGDLEGMEGVEASRADDPSLLFTGTEKIVAAHTDPGVLEGHEELLDMDTALKDGSRIILVGRNDVGTTEIEAQWVNSRKLVGAQWVDYGKWVLWQTRVEVPFEPVGWRKAEGI